MSAVACFCRASSPAAKGSSAWARPSWAIPCRAWTRASHAVGEASPAGSLTPGSVPSGRSGDGSLLVGRYDGQSIPDPSRAAACPGTTTPRTRHIVATTNDLKNGLVLNLDGQLWSVVEFQHVKPGKGGAFVRTKLKNVLSGKVVDKTFNAGTKVDTATVDKRDMQYLYKDGTDYVFMDMNTYDQLHVPADTVGTAANFLLENQEAIVAMHEGTPLYVEPPTSVVLEITYTEPGLQGDRSTGGTKPATVETGYEIAVPLFLETGTKVKIDTRSGDYLGRVND